MFYICNSAKKEKEEEKKLTICWTWPVKIETFIKTFFICDAEPPPVVQMYNNHDSFKVWKLKFLKFKPHWKPKGEMFLHVSRIQRVQWNWPLDRSRVLTFYSYFDRLSKTQKKKKERERSRVQTVREEQKKVLIREKQQRQGKGKGKGGGVV